MQRTARYQQIVSDRGRKRKLEGWSFGKSSSRFATDKASNTVTEPPGGKQWSPDRSRPPDGTGRRRGGRAMKAGSFGNHRDADPGRLQAAMPADAQGKANGNRRSPKIDRAHAGDLGAGGNVGPICFCGVWQGDELWRDRAAAFVDCIRKAA